MTCKSSLFCVNMAKTHSLGSILGYNVTSKFREHLLKVSQPLRNVFEWMPPRQQFPAIAVLGSANRQQILVWKVLKIHHLYIFHPGGEIAFHHWSLKITWFVTETPSVVVAGVVRRGHSLCGESHRAHYLRGQQAVHPHHGRTRPPLAALLEPTHRHTGNRQAATSGVFSDICCLQKCDQKYTKKKKS